VRLFSQWSELTDPAARRLLEPTGWVAPTKGYPTGAQWVQDYLAPLAGTLGDRVRYGSRVVGVGRTGRDLSVDAGRAEQPFVVHVRGSDGREERIEARAVIDASGAWRAPSPVGADGLPTLGELAAVEAGLLDHRIPSRDEAGSLAGKHVVVVGSGHSAATAIGDLASVVRRDPHTRVTWVLRRGSVGNAFGGGAADELPERGALPDGPHRRRVRAGLGEHACTGCGAGPGRAAGRRLDARRRRPGIATLLQATAITDRWGPHAYGHLSGVLGLPVLLTTALAPWAGAVLADVTGGYATAFAVLAAVAAVGTVLMVASTRTSAPGRAEGTASETA